MPCGIRTSKEMFDKYNEVIDKGFKYAKLNLQNAEGMLKKGLGKVYEPLGNVEFLTIPETKEMVFEVQKTFYNAMADINYSANQLREAMKQIGEKNGELLVRALDGSLDREHLDDFMKQVYDGVRENISKNANKLVEAGLLKKENYIEDYVKRIYESHLNEKERAGRFFSSLKKRRDLTYDERTALNQVMDASIVVPQTIFTQRRQLALGKFFESLAEKFAHEEPYEGSMRVEDINVGGGVKKYGALSGKYVDKEVYQMLKDMPVAKEAQNSLAQMVHLWTQVVGHFKVNVTVKNPVTHLYNVASNVQLAFLNGDLLALGKIMKMRFEDKAGFEDLVKRANQYGFNSRLDVAEETDYGIKDTSIASIGLRILKEAYMTKDSKTGLALRSAYDWEDKIFKLAAFKKYLDQGMEEKVAFDRANEIYIDYSTPIPNAWSFADKLGLSPFVHYVYKSTPATLKVIAKNPMRYLAGQFLLWSVGGSWLFNEDDDWSKPKWASDQWNLFFAKEWAKISDDNYYINVGRALPGIKLGFFNFAGDVWNMPLGFIGSLAQIARGKTPLGYNIDSKYDDAFDSAIKRMGAFAENFAPPMSPIGRYGQRILAAGFGEGKKNYYNERMGVPEIVLRAVGIRRFNPGAEALRKARDADRKLSHILNDPTKSEKEKAAAEVEYREAMKKLPLNLIF